MKALCLIAQAHGSNTSGKCSPDKQFYEWKWSREFTNLLVIKLKEELGIHSIIINTEDTEVKLLDQAKRVNEYINEYKKEFDTIFLISPHVNAGPEFKWSKANGFTAFVGTKAGKESKRLASIFGQTAEEMKLEGDRWLPKEKYLSKALTICNATNCPAVLTENMFMTNKEDVEFLKSDEGKQKLIKLHIEAIRKWING